MIKYKSFPPPNYPFRKDSTFIHILMYSQSIYYKTLFLISLKKKSKDNLWKIQHKRP